MKPKEFTTAEVPAVAKLLDICLIKLERFINLDKVNDDDIRKVTMLDKCMRLLISADQNNKDFEAAIKKVIPTLSDDVVFSSLDKEAKS